MSKNKSSQTHNEKNDAGAEHVSDASGDSTESLRWDPMTPFRLGFTMWTRLATDQIARVQSFYDEVAEIEGQSYERARRTGRELANMFEQNVGYVASLNAEWQALTLESLRKSREMLSPRSAE